MGETSAAEQQPSRQAVDVSAAEPSAAEPSGGGRVSSPQGGGASTAQGECKQCKGSHKQKAGNRASGAMQGLALYSQGGGLQLAILTS